MQSTRNFVSVAAKLAAGVQHGEHHFSGALAFVRAGRIGVDGNAATVVFNFARTIGCECDDDLGAEARHRFIDGVVNNFPDEVMETSETCGPDVHTGTFTNGVETFENLNVLCAVIGGRVLRWCLL